MNAPNAPQAPATPALRIKSRWFRAGAPRGPAEQASAMGFIVWRVARAVLERMRGAHFDIDAGPAYFEFLRETLAFAVACVDRLAHARLDAAARVEFTTALVRQVARTLQDNEDELLGAPPPGAPGHREAFIDLVNARMGEYADFGADAARAERSEFEPDFGFLRYYGSCLEPTLPPKDRPWVIDQVMAAEAPQLVATLRGAMA
ncbi:MAG: hypothetical protein KGJ30_01580, partial [Burkholderiales bacterium]|nr:hypothetical protein [Burkholderiales bacterium]